MLEETAASMASSAKPAFTTVKLPYCGVILLIWRAAQEAHFTLPAPSAVVERLVRDIHSKGHPPLKYAARPAMKVSLDAVCTCGQANGLHASLTHPSRDSSHTLGAERGESCISNRQYNFPCAGMCRESPQWTACAWPQMRQSDSLCAA